jgi:uncharacterized membrane protein YdcZ (DUF606 family)
MYLILAVFIGFAIIFSCILNGKLAEKIGLMNGMIVNYLTAFTASVVLFLIMRKDSLSPKVFATIPPYYFLGGFIGVVILLVMNIIVPKIPSVYVVILPFIGQILTSAVIDYIYLDIFSKGKIIGGILFLIGLFYNINVDRKYSASAQ